MAENPQKPTNISAELPAAGLPGQNASHTVVPIFPQGDPRNQGGPAGLPGDYEVMFTFNRPGYPLGSETSIASGESLEGDSHLQITNIFRLESDVEGEKFTFEGKPNSRGFLGSFTVQCHAQNLKDAPDKCVRALTPTLSNFSLRWDVPLVVYQIDVKELKRGTLRITNKVPFREVAIKGQFCVSVNSEVRTYGAVYREALATDSLPYQCNCSPPSRAERDNVCHAN
jgi:hypothetical protein